ncbi:inositol monophosphatase ttx-7-like [Lucilia cuprina]|uniref:inositol monophosphatase ttx-7-like n=1 Tax=Lucilia cuprina TaxID=7375 RepID=UPI001F05C626|nr:inositol monophosphatase ttx-7-like [Lucilia cuprina]
MSSSPTKEELKKYYDVTLDLVMKCGPIMREGYMKTESTYEVKSAYYDLVTVYDKQIEDLLISGLQAAFPESKVIGEEESAANKRLAELTDAPTWIIDPIDGTTNFINRIPHCCISVGLAINKELVVGVVYNPIANEMYSAWKGHGAYLNGQPIEVSKNCTSIKNAVVGFEISLIHVPAVRDKNVKRLCKLASNGTGTRGMGSAALMMCYVAKGSFQCFHVEDLQPWDIAAGAIILTEAGGFITHTSGAPFNIMKPDLICASTKELLKEVKELIEEADALTDFEFK